jgi:predicted transcriptional regulator
VSESQVIVVPRAPKGRKRSGGGYLGRSKKRSASPSTTSTTSTSRRSSTTSRSRSLSQRDRELAAVLDGPDWATAAALAAATGITEKQLSARLSRLRHYGPPEFTLLSRGVGGRPVRLGVVLEYRVEKGKAPSASE